MRKLYSGLTKIDSFQYITRKPQMTHTAQIVLQQMQVIILYNKSAQPAKIGPANQLPTFCFSVPGKQKLELAEAP